MFTCAVKIISLSQTMAPPLANPAKRCSYGVKCTDTSCVRLHPPGRREVCSQGALCEERFDHTCPHLHPFSNANVPCIRGCVCRFHNDRVKHPEGCHFNHDNDCRNGVTCQYVIGNRCTHAHPPVCPLSEKCTSAKCRKENWHPPQCKFGRNCNRDGCKYAH